MKYLIIGAGGTGGVLGYNMSRAGLDVAFLARGPHLRAMWGQGLILEKMWKGSCENVPVKAYDEEHYYDEPDVIFVCVKSYSLKEVIPFIRRISKPETVVIPLCNVFGTGGMLQTKLPKQAVLDGCIYVSANIKSPGWILQHSEILLSGIGLPAYLLAGGKAHLLRDYALKLQHLFFVPVEESQETRRRSGRALAAQKPQLG